MVKAGEKGFVVDAAAATLSLEGCRSRPPWSSGRTGERRLAEAPAEQQAVLERVTRRIEAELRRRLGGAFTAEELVDLYDAAARTGRPTSRWRAAPEEPFAWDARVVGDAAFARYLRAAADFAGGRRRF